MQSQLLRSAFRQEKGGQQLLHLPMVDHTDQGTLKRAKRHLAGDVQVWTRPLQADYLWTKVVKHRLDKETWSSKPSYPTLCFLRAQPQCPLWLLLLLLPAVFIQFRNSSRACMAKP